MKVDPRIVFYDPLCPTPYTRATLEQRALGGTEATVVRIAEALDAVVMQHCRANAEGRYLPLARMSEVEHVVVVRDARALADMHACFPNAQLHVWLHDQVAPGSSRSRWLARAGRHLDSASLICVSDYLSERVEATIRSLGCSPGIDVRTVYNPIADDLAPGGGFDDAKLLFMSSPNKGLRYALTAFQAIRRALPQLRLCVANPGYRQSTPLDLPGVEWLGALAHTQAMAEARSSLCVFMPNFILPETFGLVLAEANAVGTPVLAHSCGAAREVLHENNPVLPVRNCQREFARMTAALGWRALRLSAGIGRRLGIFDDYVDLLRLWRAGQRPRVDAMARYRLSSVVHQWRSVLA